MNDIKKEGIIMSTTINQTPNVYNNTQPKQKSHTARNTLGLAGLAIGTTCATDGFEKSFETSVNEAVQSYRKNMDILNRTFNKKEYVTRFIKDAKTKAAVLGAGVAITATASGLAAGTLIDAITNRNK